MMRIPLGALLIVLIGCAFFGRGYLFDAVPEPRARPPAAAQPVTNDDTRLWPGQFVNVILTLGMQADAVVVPSAAVQIGQNGPYVFLVQPDSTVELRLVRVDRTLDGRTVIAEGLAAGDRVVVDGQLRLANGTRVAVQRGEVAPPPKPPAVPVAER